MKYSVLLLYPGYLSDGPETYLAWVVARDPQDAVAMAQIVAAGEDQQCKDDFKVLLLVEGHHNDVKPD
jgi:hypothetical protein